MKKTILTVVIVIALIATGVIVTLKSKKDAPPPPGSEIAEYWPFKANTCYEYEGKGHELASYNVFNTFIRENEGETIVQQRLEPALDYNRQTQVLSLKGGELRLINGDTAKYHFEDMTVLPPDPKKEMLVLREPLSLGEKWTVSGTDTSEVTGVDVEVDTPMGKLKALEISTSSVGPTGARYDQKDWYVKDIGHVKMEYSVNGQPPISSTLKKITENYTLNIPADVYYPIKGESEAGLEEKKISLNTNYDLLAKINALLSSAPESAEFSPIMTSGKVIDIKFATNTSAAMVNFDKSIYGRQFESENEERGMLFGAAQTIGHILGVEQVFVQADGKPYSGVYVKLTDDTSFEVVRN
ncbi:MAG: GerMN domain-containing protein [Clostridiales bacterium]|jgi:hypothetical protein|nr:GerMN domain-containing protein [Clostridiales bacterium]